ncbi:hypothetical protein J6590_084034 [Homalodisca vitripennis]|nr:hypothetical protein J6590_084034 [Homalodisca vitripennis]
MSLHIRVHQLQSIPVQLAKRQKPLPTANLHSVTPRESALINNQLCQVVQRYFLDWSEDFSPLLLPLPQP